jgi:prepilin-type N-terminal cleavage/methylation domain-containing protein/prepilin-type processing-associated H-X9-DG protein
MKRYAGKGFTLIELLVVVAIIALLISILLPSLSCARNSAKATKCGALLRSLSTALTTYATENKDWIPGRNTTGVGFFMEIANGNPAAGLRNSKTAVQTYDWITSLLRYETSDLGNNRAERFQILVNRYQCPANAASRIDELYDVGLAVSQDRDDFRAINDWSPLSYLMPAAFQIWGQSDAGLILARAQSGVQFAAKTYPNFWEVTAENYRSRLDQVGNQADKIAIVDGNRFLTGDGVLDFDVNPNPDWFGSFTASSGWWAGSHEFGVRTPCQNWDGQTVSGGGFPEHSGRNLALTYRHGCSTGAVPQLAQDNKGSVNAAYFDGHVARLGDRASREIRQWYPRGSVVRKANEGMTHAENGDVVP